MQTYLYCWSLRPRPDIRVEVRVEAESVCVARRQVDGFLREQTAGDWRVEGVERLSPGGHFDAAVPLCTATGAPPPVHGLR